MGSGLTDSASSTGLFQLYVEDKPRPCTMKLGDLIDTMTKWPFFFRLICVFLYSFSPIDIIPDFLPVVGQMDDFYVIYQLIVKPLFSHDNSQINANNKIE